MHDALMRHAAQGDVVHNDDTSMTVLELGERTRDEALAARTAPLLIDDEPLVLRSLARTLGAVHDVTTALGADEALALLGREDFDVILCDVMMPGRTGVDLYEQLNRDQPELTSRVVFVSGGAYTDRAKAFLAQVTNPTLSKPLDGGELGNLIQERLRDRTGRAPLVEA